VLLGAGAMYVTVNEGIWSTSESGLCAAQRLRTYVLPETTQYWDKVNAYLMYNTTTYNNNNIDNSNKKDSAHATVIIAHLLQGFT